MNDNTVIELQPDQCAIVINNEGIEGVYMSKSDDGGEASDATWLTLLLCIASRHEGILNQLVSIYQSYKETH